MKTRDETVQEVLSEYEVGQWFLLKTYNNETTYPRNRKNWIPARLVISCAEFRLIGDGGTYMSPDGEAKLNDWIFHPEDYEVVKGKFFPEYQRIKGGE